MLAGFLLMALLLSWAAVRSWLVLEQFVEQSRRSSEQALHVSAAIQELAERTVDLERSARQFMILNDSALLDRFDENQARALSALSRLEAVPGEAPGSLTDAWRKTLARLSRGLHQEAPEAEQASALPPILARLAELNRELEQNGRRWIDGQQATMIAELEQARGHLAGRLAATVVGAFLLALAMNWWLSRPLENLERTIERLGESRFDAPVRVGGPADLRRLGRRLDWLRARLGELEAGREQTLRHVSHELKTPLTALREGIALLQEGVVGSLEGAQQEVVDILQDKVMILQGQIESLLRLNAAAFETRPPSYRPLPLRQLLADVVSGRDLQIKARQLTVRSDAPAITRALDREKLLVALDNLLSNAIDFSPVGGVIQLQARLINNTLRIACSDQGPGIAAEDAERIFEPFVQGGRAPPTPRQGSGVGLSIVRELMSAMGGQVLLLPGEGKSPGATFMIELACEAQN
jgi:two-component system sensor histidine kinase GlrK